MLSIKEFHLSESKKPQTINLAFDVLKNGVFFNHFKVSFDLKNKRLIIPHGIAKKYPEVKDYLDSLYYRYEYDCIDMRLLVEQVKSFKKKKHSMCVSGLFSKSVWLHISTEDSASSHKIILCHGHGGPIGILEQDKCEICYANIEMFDQEVNECFPPLFVMVKCDNEASGYEFSKPMLKYIVDNAIPMPEIFENKDIYFVAKDLQALFLTSLPFVKRLKCSNFDKLFSMPADIVTGVLSKIHTNRLNRINQSDLLSYYLSHNLMIPDVIQSRLKSNVSEEIDLYM